MEYLNTAQELLDFIMRCKSPFHVVKEASDLLNENWRRQKNGVSFRAENIM